MSEQATLGWVIVYVPDVERAVDFYERAFGLRRAFVEPHRELRPARHRHDRPRLRGGGAGRRTPAAGGAPSPRGRAARQRRARPGVRRRPRGLRPRGGRGVHRPGRARAPAPEPGGGLGARPLRHPDRDRVPDRGQLTSASTGASHTGYHRSSSGSMGISFSSTPLQPQLDPVVALLAGARREGVEGAALVAVDEVDRAVVGAEAEHRAEELLRVAALLQRLAHEVGGGDHVVEVGVGDDHPREAERVRVLLGRCRPPRWPASGAAGRLGHDLVEEVASIGLKHAARPAVGVSRAASGA